MYCHAAKIQADAEETQADANDKMEDDVNNQQPASPGRVEEGTAADFNDTTYGSRRIADEHSIFVGDLEYEYATEAEIKAFFARCGEIRRVTIRAPRSQVCVFES